MNYPDVLPYIEKGLINEQRHPEDNDVAILNYSQKTQFSQAWDDITRQCRGLILNVKTGEVIARPFPKFYNYQEHVAKGWPIPNSLPVVAEKLDGSLGILYALNGKPWIATRGSFTSDQAIWATEWWRDSLAMLPTKGETHLFEIIAFWNRIVVKYDYEGLVHLATIDTATGMPIRHYWGDPIRTPKQYNPRALDELAQLDPPNSEGFVVFFPDENVRVKIKHAEYVRLHKLITGVNEIAIWEHLRDNKSLDDLIEKVPDEFYQWVAQTSNRLNAAFDAIRDQAERDFNECITVMDNSRVEEGPRKVFAMAAQKKQNPGLMFAMLDNKPITSLIWRMIRPHGQSASTKDIDA